MHHHKQFTDRDNLMKRAYADQRHLQVRLRTHELYTVPKFDFQEWVLSQHRSWQGDEMVLDIGCGMGDYFEGVLKRLHRGGQYIAGDLSIGMLRSAAEHTLANQVNFSVEDVQYLPFATNSFDVVLANHMLYHVPKLSHALSEIHRVLRPDGVLITAVNSQFTMLEFNTLTRRALTLLGHALPDEGETSISFEGYSLENASMKLARYFRGVVRYEIPSALVFDDPQPVIDYLESTRALREDTLPAGVIWEDFMLIMRSQVERLISHFGELVVNKLTGVLIGTDAGGFAENYFENLDRQS